MLADLHLALRMVAKNPGFSALVVLTVALGIGTSTAVFSVVDAVLLRPLPFPNADRIVRFAEGYEGAAPLRPGARLGSMTYHAWKDASPRTVDALEGYTEASDAVVHMDGGRALVSVARATAGLLQVLGASAAVGRLFVESDGREGAESVVVLSDRLWRERFGSERAAVGRSLTLSGQPHRVIGVAPAGFAFPDGQTRMWAMLDVPRPTGPPQNPRFTTLLAVGRLRPGVTPDQAAAEATAIARGIDPKPLAARITFGDGGPAFVRARTLLGEVTSAVEGPLIVLAAGVACVLLIVCVNVANLLLSRGVARQRELAVRTALGAHRMALARHLLAESLVLSTVGGALGVLLAFWLVHTLPLLAPADFPRLDEVRVDLRVLTTAVLLSVAAGLVSGLAPIAGMTRVDFGRAFRGDGMSGSVEREPRGRRTRTVLHVMESAFAVVLLIAAMLLARSFLTLMRVDRGYATDGVIVADVLRPDTTVESARRYAPVMREALARVRTLPGVTAAAIGSMSPLDGNTSLQGFPVPGSLTSARMNATGQAPQTALTRSYAVTPGYASALGLRLREGRFFTEADGRGPDVRWIVNEEFASRYLPQNPVGRRFPWQRGNQAVQLEIVGVVKNVLKDGNAGEPSPEVYRMLRDSEPFFNYQLIARTANDAEAIGPSIRNAILDVAPDATVILIPLSQRFSASIAQPRLATTVFGTLAVVASLLTAVGLFAALSYSLSRRRHEFGIRIAVGATRFDLVRTAVWQAMAPTVGGILLGLVAAVGVTRFMQRVLFGVTPLDTVSFVAAPLFLIPVALAACLWPAVRAARVDPVLTLRAE